MTTSPTLTFHWFIRKLLAVNSTPEIRDKITPDQIKINLICVFDLRYQKQLNISEIVKGEPEVKEAPNNQHLKLK